MHKSSQRSHPLEIKIKTLFISNRTSIHGFTLVEIIATLIILGILAAVAIPRFTDANSSVIVDVQNLKSCLRKTQTRSLADAYTTTAGDSNWSLEISANSAIIKRAGVTKDTCSFNSTSISGGPIYFDNRGRPVNSSGQVLTSTTSFTVPGYGNPIIVIPVTGFVE